MGVATPTTFAGGGLLAAVELLPPHAVNSTAAMAVNKAVMIFTRDLLLSFTHSHCAERAGQAQCVSACRSLASTDHSLMEWRVGFLMQIM